MTSKGYPIYGCKRIAWFLDESLRADANARGLNHWPLYTGEILDGLGVRAHQLSPDDEIPGSVRFLLINPGDIDSMPDRSAEKMRRWVESGGTLIGFMAEGLDDVFGIRQSGADPHYESWTIGRWMSMNGDGEAAIYLDESLPATDCPILSPSRNIAVEEADILACFMDNSPAITRRAIGHGRAFYFAFDLPRAIWTYRQGRPIIEDIDGDGYLRSGDALIVKEAPTFQVPCADLLLQIIENIIASTGSPFIDALPPMEGAPSDALFHYGGDDEAREGLQSPMSDIMAGLSLPYHINVMLGQDGQFHFSDEDMALYRKRGHEVSIHPNFIHYPEGVKHPEPIDENEFDRQLKLFLERYGFTPVCFTNHYICASGWADSARFGAKRGLKGENACIHHPSPPMDPVNLFGCPFGTVYPFFVYDDAAHGNERYDFVNIPIGFYEPGSPSRERTHPFYEKEPYRPDEYQHVVDMACRGGWTLNIFMHPTHMSNPNSRGRDALRCMLDRIGELRAWVVHTGTDALCLWWHERSRTEIAEIGDGAWRVATGHPDGITLRFSVNALPKNARFTLDGAEIPGENRLRNGREWIYIVIASGQHELRLII